MCHENTLFFIFIKPGLATSSSFVFVTNIVGMPTCSPKNNVFWNNVFVETVAGWRVTWPPPHSQGFLKFGTLQ